MIFRSTYAAEGLMVGLQARNGAIKLMSCREMFSAIQNMQRLNSFSTICCIAMPEKGEVSASQCVSYP